ncbi:HAD-IA family hydrolase [Croceicoccus marinus]|uniref:phosphoglycolate phosphatase n=1 Tax=Croceicoccus marinus TaxID=450378 RepID=A0A7G6VZI2_9SPHN|nr:HAD-IA family hydrolase [Croceicoccus marinus]QNE07147.1 HAD-IA family hydrolase [Croceicoccus marinus]
MSAELADVLVVFDLDGTLVDTAPDLLATLNRILERQNLPPVAMQDARPLMGVGARALLQLGFRLGARDWDDGQLASLVSEFIVDYRAHIADHSFLFDDALMAMDALQSAGAGLAICTNKPTHLATALLEEMDIAHRFAAITGAERDRASKPDPEHLRATMIAAGRADARAVMVGDSRNDVDAARGLGIPSIAVSFGYANCAVHELGATHVIDGFAELPACIRAVMAADRAF